MTCKHEQQHLMGTADGIICRRCGRLFKDFSEIVTAGKPAAAAAKTESPVKQPKNGRKKKEDA